MTQESSIPQTGELLADETQMTLAEVCLICNSSVEHIFEFVDEGIISPLGEDKENWHFHIVEIGRLHRALRLQRDLGVNAAGAALALQLLDEIDALHVRLGKLQD